MEDYAEQRSRYLVNPEKFWIDKVDKFHWFKKWDKLNNYALDSTDMRWFINGQINLCYEVLDRHVLNGHGNDLVLVHDSPFTNKVTKFTYNDILDQVSRLAGALADEFGVRQGDHVTIYLPTLPETPIAMLAAVRLGAIYTVMDTVHPPEAMANKLRDFQPKVIITTNCEFKADGTRFNPKKYLDSVQQMCISRNNNQPTKCIVLRRACAEESSELKKCKFGDQDWDDAIARALPHNAVPVEFNAPTLVIYTSGTTGTPKGVVISVRYLAAYLSMVRKDPTDSEKELQRHSSIRIESPVERRIMYSGSLYVWIVGQTRGCYYPLYLLHPFLLYERPLADSGMHEFYSLMIKHEVTKVFIPTQFIRTWIKQDSSGNVARTYRPEMKISSMVVGGVPGDTMTFAWLRRNWGINLFQLYGLTETGVMTAGDLSNGRTYEDQPPLSSGKAAPGVTIHVLRPDGIEADVGEAGRITLKLPTPTMCSGFLNDDQNRMFNDDYLSIFPGYFDTQDEGWFDVDGHLWVTNRVDTLFKIGGNRMSCDAIEQVILTHSEVAECVVVTRVTSDSRQLPVAFFVLNDDSVTPADEVIKDLKRILSEQLGDWVLLDSITSVHSLPKNKTGKIARGAVMAQVRAAFDNNLHDKSS